MNARYFKYTAWCLFFLIILVLTPQTNAQSVDELKNQITSKNSEIAQLEKEIAEYQKKIAATKGQSSTLNAELARLESSKKKLETDVALTRKKISATELTIKKLGSEIATSASKIETNHLAVAAALREMKDADTFNFTVAFLSNDTLSDFLNDYATLESFRGKLEAQILELKKTKTTYEKQKSESEEEKLALTSLQSKLADQRQIVTQNQSEKSVLLSQTKAQEASYQQLLADRIAKKNAVEAEIRKAEDALNLIVNPGSLPATGRGVIKWPFDKVVVTQYFGNTPFATANAQIYKGAGHNGIDLAAAVGTPVKAVLDGTVIGVGDTDLTCPRASYGRWVMVRHNNGLSSVYGHLSLPKVVEGQTVKTGDIVAYSGNTGYTTGPHLHFTLLATQGSQIGSLQSKVPGCGVYRIPLATKEAVLNPLSYL
ncbi:MAG: hypothetical protein A2589_01240 [Candidatus Vogelbacteria bacterium RIFOXYD1_FULL_46_19]|uniref:M23ase beta-sheet core domain-containing protein n=1 Tax=Candidatus Vogelbacteria bacterium RIFOXYD1_FULL_46_19 TaxID=1802439 RepID=A0A1G2QFS9_9BACT|nr:MAG: hypothetical protein A2589_01240 [Candidatus Vogelbacteria bacterium RIFOXYD1_FULL_46_19]